MMDITKIVHTRRFASLPKIATSSRHAQKSILQQFNQQQLMQQHSTNKSVLNGEEPQSEGGKPCEAVEEYNSDEEESNKFDEANESSIIASSKLNQNHTEDISAQNRLPVASSPSDQTIALQEMKSLMVELRRILPMMNDRIGYHPTNVADIRHAYTDRARAIEKQRAERARDMAEFKRLSRTRQEKKTFKRKNYPQRSAAENRFASGSPIIRGIEDKALPIAALTVGQHTQPLNNDSSFQQCTPREEDERVCIIGDVNYAKVCTDAIFKMELLSKIRKGLLAGKKVELRMDCDKTGDSIQDAKFLVLQICSESIAYCHRSQEMVPSIVGQVVCLTLTPKDRLVT